MIKDSTPAKPIHRNALEVASLTGLRGVAALCVLFFHVRLLRGGTELTFWIFDPLSKFGYLGVDIFFILSGYLLSYIYSAQFAHGVDKQGYRSFFAARIARIYPLHFVTTFLMLGVYVVGLRLGVTPTISDGYTLKSTLVSLLMVHQWFGITAPNLVSWSISVEFASYILFPLYVAAFARLRRYWPLFVLPVGIVAAQFFPHERLIRGMAEFLVGCSVYGLQHNYRFRFRLPFISLLAFAIPFAAFGVLGHEMLWLAIVGFSVVVFCLATDTSSDWLCRFCAWRPVAFIGDISYSIYLLQWSVWATWKHLGPRVPFLAGHNYLIISLAILNVVAVAAASFFWFEKPTRTWLRKALSSRPVPDVSVATTKTP